MSFERPSHNDQPVPRCRNPTDFSRGPAAHPKAYFSVALAGGKIYANISTDQRSPPIYGPSGFCFTGPLADGRLRADIRNPHLLIKYSFELNLPTLFLPFTSSQRVR